MLKHSFLRQWKENGRIALFNPIHCSALKHRCIVFSRRQNTYHVLELVLPYLWRRGKFFKNLSFRLQTIRNSAPQNDDTRAFRLPGNVYENDIFTVYHHHPAIMQFVRISFENKLSPWNSEFCFWWWWWWKIIGPTLI